MLESEPCGAHHLRAVPHRHVREGRVRADDGVARHRGGAVQLGPGRDRDVSWRVHVNVDPGRGGVDDGDAGAHPALEGAPVHFPAQGGELDAVVGALDLPGILGDDGGHAATGPAGDGQHVREVLLALRVVGGDVRQRGAQDTGVERVDAGVDLADVPLLGVVASLCSTMAVTVPSAARRIRP